MATTCKQEFDYCLTTQPNPCCEGTICKPLSEAYYTDEGLTQETLAEFLRVNEEGDPYTTEEFRKYESRVISLTVHPRDGICIKPSFQTNEIPVRKLTTITSDTLASEKYKYWYRDVEPKFGTSNSKTRLRLRLGSSCWGIGCDTPVSAYFVSQSIKEQLANPIYGPQRIETGIIAPFIKIIEPSAYSLQRIGTYPELSLKSQSDIARAYGFSQIGATLFNGQSVTFEFDINLAIKHYDDRLQEALFLEEIDPEYKGDKTPNPYRNLTFNEWKFTNAGILQLYNPELNLSPGSPDLKRNPITLRIGWPAGFELEKIETSRRVGGWDSMVFETVLVNNPDSGLFKVGVRFAYTDPKNQQQGQTNQQSGASIDPLQSATNLYNANRDKTEAEIIQSVESQLQQQRQVAINVSRQLSNQVSGVATGASQIANRTPAGDEIEKTINNIQNSSLDANLKNTISSTTSAITDAQTSITGTASNALQQSQARANDALNKALNPDNLTRIMAAASAAATAAKVADTINKINSINKELDKLPTETDTELMRKEKEDEALEMQAEYEKQLLAAKEEAKEKLEGELINLAMSLLPIPKLPMIDPKVLMAVAIAKQAKDAIKQRKKRMKENQKKAEEIYEYPIKSTPVEVPQSSDALGANLPSPPKIPDIPQIPNISSVLNV